MWVLPSYIVSFAIDNTGHLVDWQVNTDETLEAICKTLRLNGISEYHVKPFKHDTGVDT